MTGICGIIRLKNAPPDAQLTVAIIGICFQITKRTPEPSHSMKTIIAMALIVTLFLVLAGVETSQAVPITYIFSGVGSGSLGTGTFSDVSYVITLFADTKNIVTTPLLFGESHVPDSSATLFVNGLGTATISSQLEVNDFENLGTEGAATISLIVRTGSSSAPILGVHPFSKNYYLGEPIGPVGGPGVNYQDSGVSISTSDGDFTFSSLSSVRFQATLQPVPEPSWLALVCTAGLTLGLFTRNRRIHS
jgi:hypothetical protein